MTIVIYTEIAMAGGRFRRRAAARQAAGGMEVSKSVRRIPRTDRVASVEAGGRVIDALIGGPAICCTGRARAGLFPGTYVLTANSGSRADIRTNGSAKLLARLILPGTATSEGLAPMIRELLERADCGTARVLIHSRKDGAMALGTWCRKLIASEIPTV